MTKIINPTVKKEILRLSDVITGDPPTEIPIVYLAGEFGCEYTWFIGFCTKSSGQNDETSYFTFPWFMGYPVKNPPFHAPVYRGIYRLILDCELRDFIYFNHEYIKKESNNAE